MLIFKIVTSELDTENKIMYSNEVTVAKSTCDLPVWKITLATLKRLYKQHDHPPCI